MGGQKKKIIIVSAIIKHPGILILDEAFNGLDSKSAREIQDLVKLNFAKSLVISIDHNTDNHDNLLQISNQRLTFINSVEDNHQSNVKQFLDVNKEVCLPEYYSFENLLPVEDVCPLE